MVSFMVALDFLHAKERETIRLRASRVRKQAIESPVEVIPSLGAQSVAPRWFCVRADTGSFTAAHGILNARGNVTTAE